MKKFIAAFPHLVSLNRVIIFFVAAISVAGILIYRKLEMTDVSQTNAPLRSSSADQYPPADTVRSVQPSIAAESVMGNGPLRVDTANPRYFMDGNGKLVYLAGSHFWDTLQDSGSPDDLPFLFDYSKWLDFLESQNHNFFRLYSWQQAKWVPEMSAPYYWLPNPFLRTGPGLALDDKPKFDLTKFDQSYFDRMRQRTIEAGNRGMYVSIMLFNGWSTDTKAPWGGGVRYPWEGHPFNVNNNINGINGDTNGDNSGIEIEDLSIPAVTAIEDAYVKKVVDTVNDLDNVLYEICNECADGSWQSSDSTLWQYHMIELIHTYEAGKSKQHPVGISQISADDRLLLNSEAEWVSIHDSGSLESPYISDGSKVVVVDTDHVCGICGDRIWVWKTFMHGKNPLFMDNYNDSYGNWGYDLNNPNDTSLRQNLGYTRNFANRIDLKVMTPRGDLSSSGFALANPVASGAGYLVYLPSGGGVTVNLSASPGLLNYEWFNPAIGATVPGGTVVGGDSRFFGVPFSGDAVLYIYNDLPPTQTPTATRTNTPLPPTATRTKTPIGLTGIRTITPFGPTDPRTATATSTLDFSTPTPTSPLTFPSLTLTPPGGATVTPTHTAIIPTFTPSSTLTSTPVPTGGTARTFLYCIVGILISAAIVGVLFYLFWIFRQLNRPG